MIDQSQSYRVSSVFCTLGVIASKLYTWNPAVKQSEKVYGLVMHGCFHCPTKTIIPMPCMFVQHLSVLAYLDSLKNSLCGDFIWYFNGLNLNHKWLY